MRKLLSIALVMALAPLVVGLGRAAPPPPTPMIYVPVDDGTEIALRVFYPDGYVAGRRYPTLVQAEGYGGASSPNDSSFVGNKSYIVVGVSLRGTGCSAGTFALFSERSSQDVAWIIDNWIPKQRWSNGDVGIYGHSYGGLTGFLIAAEHPKHLRAVAVSGLIDDFYRGIIYPGGVMNYGFPVLWGAASRPLSEHQSNQPFIMEDQHCAANYALHLGTDLLPQPQQVVDTYGSPFATPESWAITNSLMAHINGIKVPIQLGQQYQDEQTGPRGGQVLWENIPRGLPKRMTISTGRHNPNDPTGNKRDWFDCWILGKGSRSARTTLGHRCADVLDPKKRVLLYFESMGADRLAPYIASDWPLPSKDVTWTRYYLRGNGTLSRAAGKNDTTVQYLDTANGRHTTMNMGHSVPLPTNDSTSSYGFTTGLPDAARYTLDFTRTTALAGPINLSLWAQLSSQDGDLWAEILDVNKSTGETVFVQRGLLRASYNATFDARKSRRTPAGDIYRPWYGYTMIAPVMPMSINKYEIEIWPLGHVWRAGHQLVLQIHTPPVSDPISIYMYETNAPGMVTILQDAEHPTSILLPVMKRLPPMRKTAPACGAVAGELCITPQFG